MNSWEKARIVAEEGPFKPLSGAGMSQSKNDTRNLRLTDLEIDAILRAMEISKERNFKGIDIDSLERKIYKMKVHRESMGSGNSTSQGDSGEIESEVERSY